MRRENQLLAIYLSLIYLTNNAECLSILHLRPPPLWAILNYDLTNAFFFRNGSTEAAQCKMTCFVLPQCSYAQIGQIGSVDQCQIGTANNSSIYQLIPRAGSMVIFNPNGFGLYDPTAGTANKFPNLPGDIIQVSETTKLYYSLRDPEHIYWILNKPMVRAEAIGNCSSFANTSLAYFMNLQQMEIGIFILFAENSTLTLDQYNHRPTFHIDMNTLPNMLTATTWPLVVGRQRTVIPAAVFSSDPRFLANGLPTGTYTLYVQWMGRPTLNDHNNDDNVAALCCTRVFGFTD